MPIVDVSGRWDAWIDELVADSFYLREFAAQPEYKLQIPGHWQREAQLARHQGSVFYRTTFDWQPSFTWPVIRLHIGGAFYTTTVWLNGEKLGQHDGYFEPMTWELRPEQLQPTTNVLAMRVDCPPPGKTWRDIVIGIYGEWDCKPDWVNPGGIWGDVVVIETFRGYLRQPQIESRLTAWNSAQIRVQAEVVWRSVAGQVKAVVSITPRNFVGKSISQTYDCNVQPGENQLDLKLTLPEPKLWSTWDLGQPHLYNVTLQLFDEQGHEIDSYSSYLGVRDIGWKDWQLSLNGQRLFLRGTNYGPTSFFPAEVDVATLEQDVKLLREANLNSVRVHGHIAPPAFYQFCAEAGLLVWQDFALDKRYDRNITGVALRQIRSMVTLLRNEPAICFWSCHNEPYALPRSQQRRPNMLRNTARSTKPSWNKDILDPRLREAVLKLDQSRPVLAHSGVFGFLRGGSDTHHYYGWNTHDYRTLAILARLFPRILRLVSEYGAQSVPTDPEFLAELTALGAWPELDWEAVEREYQANTHLLHQHVPPGEYADVRAYAEATQQYQAELLQFYHEFLRRHKYRPCGGALSFYFADAMPLISWSLLDAKRQPKLAYFVTQRAMEPIQIMVNWPKPYYFPGEKWSSPIYIVNDWHRPFIAVGVTWQLLTAAGESLMRERGVADVAADSVSRAGRLTFTIPEGVCEDLKLELVLTLPTNQSIKNEYKIRVQC
ncbi:MAG: hypothetical protein GX060_02920 [Firmicutes bacterium]|nr:hypothetical protein [Bacillota bacterium]